MSQVERTITEPIDKITRIEVIGTGREYTSWQRRVLGFSVQDDGRTLKIFLMPKDLE